MCLLWGYNWVALKIALRHAGVFDFTALRIVLATLLLFPSLQRIELNYWRHVCAALGRASGGIGYSGRKQSHDRGKN